MGTQDRKKIALPIFSSTVILLISLVLLEVFFQIIHLNKNYFDTTYLRKLSRILDPPFTWERYFLANYAEGKGGGIPNVAQDGMHQPHGTRGWVLKPDIMVKRDGKTYTTNGQGYRSLGEYKFDPEKYGVMILGDSFTFGDGIDDTVTWPYLLQEMDNRLNVFNMSGSGYGVDQMYITLLEEVSTYRPKLIIAAFIDDNLRRSMLDFRDYKKPRFEIQDGKLVLRNVPVGDVDEVIREISEKKRYSESSIQLINIYHKIRWEYVDTNYIKHSKRSDLKAGCRPDCTTLNNKIFENMAAVAAQNDADFLMIYLPHGEELFNQQFFGYGEEYFMNYKIRHGNYFLNPRKDFLTANFQKSRGHYEEVENKFISKLVYKNIQEIPSWIKFKRNY